MIKRIVSLFKPKDDGSYEMAIISNGDCGAFCNNINLRDEI